MRTRTLIAGTLLAIAGAASAVTPGGYPSQPQFQSAGVGVPAPGAGALQTQSDVIVGGNGLFTGNSGNPNAGKTSVIIRGGNAAQIEQTNSAASIDGRVYDSFIDNIGTLHMRVLNDAQNSTTDWLSVARNGTNIGIVQISSGSLDLNAPVSIAQVNGKVSQAISGASAQWTDEIFGNSSVGNSYGLIIEAGTSSADRAFEIWNAAASSNFFKIDGGGNISAPGAASVPWPKIASAAVTGSTCTILASPPAANITACSRGGAGNYTLTLASSYFQNFPVCVLNVQGSAAGLYGYASATATTSVVASTYSASGLTDETFTIICTAAN